MTPGVRTLVTLVDLPVDGDWHGAIFLTEEHHCRVLLAAEDGAPQQLLRSVQLEDFLAVLRELVDVGQLRQGQQLAFVLVSARWEIIIWILPEPDWTGRYRASARAA